jgi:hypothetical protein
VPSGRGAFSLWVSRAVSGWRKKQIKEQEHMSIEVMRQVRNALVWNLNTDLDNIPACEQWANMLRKNIDDLDEAIEQAEQEEKNT